MQKLLKLSIFRPVHLPNRILMVKMVVKKGNGLQAEGSFIGVRTRMKEAWKNLADIWYLLRNSRDVAF